MKKILMVLGLIACGGGKPAATTATTSATATTSTRSAAEMTPAGSLVLTLASLKFYQGDDMGMTLSTEGMIAIKGMHSGGGKPVTESWNPIAQLTTDGKVMHDGKVGGQLKPDGTFELANGKPAPFRIDGTVLVIGDKKITIDDKGNVVGGNAEGKPMHIEGVTEDGSRRAALLMLGLLFAMDAEPHAAPPAH